MPGAQEPPAFLVGPAISVYQNSGGGGSNWSRFETQRNWLGRPVIEGGDRCGQSCDFWNCYEADIARAAALNSNAFRLSLEWSRLEPARGAHDRQAIARYHAIFDCLKRHGLEACVTLHHFVHPLWFEELGAFEREENIPLFVDFAAFAFREFGAKASLWATFNEINVATFCGYLYAQFPPARLLRLTQAGRVFCHMLRAHAGAYDAIKAQPGGHAARVGLVHNYLEYWPRNPEGLSAAYVRPLCRAMEAVWGTRVVLDFLATGKFVWALPWGGAVTHQEAEPPGCDWLGVNYYGRVVLDWKFQTTCLPGEAMTDMPFPLYAPGLLDACKAMSQLGRPLYVTETGVADSADRNREAMMDTYFAQVERAVEAGIDLRGVFYWTLVDNWEWAHGFHQKFGLFRWAPGDGHRRGEIASTAVLRSIFAQLPRRIAAIRRRLRPQ